MAAPIGSVVGLHYDWSGAEPGPRDGDVIVSNGGSVYAVLEARETRRPGRYQLRCLKVDPPATVAPGGRILGLQWYPRKRKTRRAVTL